MEANPIGQELAGRYRGRFAPTPSGPLHFGSLVAAVGSYLEAKRKGGEWLVRIEDLDTPRVVPGAADLILRTLEAFGFRWDGEVIWQSTRTEAYRNAFDRLKDQGHIFPCGCSRVLQEGSGCARNCRAGIAPGTPIRSWRVHVPKETVCWTDQLQGTQCDELAGDFVLLREDRIFAYQLAVVVDDAEQGITDVVRGADLLDSTFKQIRLLRWLGYPQPRYSHLPTARNEKGEKLSKQTHAAAVTTIGDAGELRAVLRFLGQPVPAKTASLQEIWKWAMEEWRSELVPV